MKKRFFLLMPILLSALLISGCSQKAKYNRMLKHELASGVRSDSLFMGLYLGMPEKKFYTRCWELNRQGLIRQGTRNMTVEYKLKDELKYPGTMDFYPEFLNGKIFEMPVRFFYAGWAPWNKKLSSDSLQMEVLKWYEKQYGNGFLEVKHPKKGSAFVKVTGNRQISIFKEDDVHVWAVFTDLLVKKGIGDTTSSVSNIQKEITKELQKKND